MHQVVKDRAAGLAAGPGGGHEHIHCSLKVVDESLLPKQILRQQQSRDRLVSTGSSAVEGGEGGRGAERGSGCSQRGGEGGTVNEEQEGERPLAVVAAKYFFNGDAAIVFRYRLYSFHRCPVSVIDFGLSCSDLGRSEG